MGAYDGWKQPQLQAEASKRGLSAGGSNDEIIARLEEWDAAHPGDEDLLGDDTPPAEAPAAPAAPAAAARVDDTAVAAAPPRQGKTYETSFPCPGELSTGMHTEYRQQAYARALAAGLTPRGGLAGVSRIRFSEVDGQRHAVYSVVLSRS